MTSKLQIELKQTRPFPSLRQEVLLNLARTTSFVLHQSEQRLRAHGLTFLQYNVLRILRGAGPAGIAQCAIRERLVTPAGDVSRVLARLEASALLVRTADTRDRRILTVCITPAGAEMLAGIGPQLDQIERTLFSALTPAQLEAFNELLTIAREPCAHP